MARRQYGTRPHKLFRDLAKAMEGYSPEDIGAVAVMAYSFGDCTIMLDDETEILVHEGHVCGIGHRIKSR